MDTDRIIAACDEDAELLKRHSKGLTETFDLSIALDRAIQHRRRMIELIERMQAQLEAKREPR